MTATQLPGQTLEPVPPSAEQVGDDQWSCLQKIVELSSQWAVQLGGSGVSGDPQDDQFTLWQKFNANLYTLP